MRLILTSDQTAQPAAQIHRNRSMQLFVRRLPVFRALLGMPPSSHWPDRSRPFAAEASEVLQFIMAHGVDLAEAKRIFDWATHVPRSCSKSNLIRFDRVSGLWCGTLLSPLC